MAGSLGEVLNGLGWRSGAVVPHGSVDTVQQFLQHPGQAPTTVLPDHWLVVVSQTCDVVAHKLESEPYVEVLHGQNIPKLRRQYKELRSTRFLDFKPNRATHGDLVLTAHAVANRYLVPRQLFGTFGPDTTRRLSDAASKRVMSWYALRYGRPAWPNAFVDRLRPVQEKLEQSLEPLTADDMAEVRVSIREWDRDLSAEEPYNLEIYFVMDAHHWQADVAGRKLVYDAFGKFVSLLRQCPGLAVDMELSAVLSGDDFTWQDTQETDLWDFANLTFRD